MKKIKIIPISDNRLEYKIWWRIFKVAYFGILGLGGSVIYSFINFWYYTNCQSTNLPWSEAKLLCTKFFGWWDLFGTALFVLIILRILYPFLEKIILYIVFNDTKK